MSTGAFHADPGVRELALERLRTHCDHGRISGGALFWGDGQCSAAGALIESSDPNEWVLRLGLAPWLAYAIDASVGGLPSEEVAPAVSSLLHALKPGSSTDKVGSLVVAAILDRLSDAIPDLSDKGAAVSANVTDLQALHLRAAAGERIGSPAWRAIRAASVTGTDQTAEPALHALASCLEAGAWDPGVSPTTVGEVLRAWLGHQIQREVDGFGWTPQDHAQVQSLLDEMHATYIADQPDEVRDVFMLLSEYHPSVEARLRAYGECSMDARFKACRSAVELLGAALRSESELRSRLMARTLLYK